MHITEAELAAARHHIREQMQRHTWWPKAAPADAKREFDLMCGTAMSLNIWCDRWLDESQCKKLEKAVRG